MKEFTQDGMFNELSKVTRALNKSKYEKMDLPQYGKGGEDPVTNSQVDSDKDYYIRMANSPLFVERYARMVGKPVDQVAEEAEAFRKGILNNIATVKVNDIGVLPKGVRKRDVMGYTGEYSPELTDESIAEAQKIIDGIPKFIRKPFQNKLNKEIANFPQHEIFLYTDDPWTKTHESSHASVKGGIDKINVNKHSFRDLSESPELEKIYKSEEEYYTMPDEQKARIDVARKYLENKGLYDPVNEPFTEKHYDMLNNEYIRNLFKQDKDLPHNVEDLMIPYDKETAIDMFNNFVSNDSKKDLSQARLGGLAKFIDGGGAIYTYSGRPDSIYKTVNGQWHIKNDSTNGQFIPINDPTGGRTNVLNQHAVKVDESLYKPKPLAIPKIQPSETTQMFQPIINNAVSAQNLNLARANDERNYNIARGEHAVIQSINDIQKNKSYNQKLKDELIKKEYDRLKFDNRNQLEESGALLNQLDQQSIKAAPEKTAGDYAERVWDVITNPFDAAKYSISGGGLENMPWNYNKMKEIGIDPSAQSYQERFSGSDKKSNMVGDVLNTFNLFDAGDKVYRNAEKGNWEDALLEATRFLEVGAFMKPGALGKITKYATNNPIDNAKNLLNSDKANAFIGSMYQKGLDIGNPIDNFVRKLGNKPYTSSDLVAKVNSLAVPAKYEDLSKGVKVLEDVSQESFDFWKTQEGRRRIKKYLDDNGLNKYGIDEDMYIDMMKDVNITKADDVKNVRDVYKEVENERELLRQKRVVINKEIDELTAKLDANGNSYYSANFDDKGISDRLDELQQALDHNMQIDSGHLQFMSDLPNYPTNNAHYRGTDESVFLGEDYVKKSNVDAAGVHEWGHAKNVQPLIKLAKAFPGFIPEIDQIALNKRLRNTLDLEGALTISNAEDLPEHLKNIDYEKLYNNAQSIAPDTVERWSLPQRYWNNQANYFMHGDEANAFLQELIPELKRRGFIKKFGDHIEPQMIDQLFADYRKEAATKIIDPIRLLDIVKPTGKSIQSITDELNNLHVLAPIAIGAGAAAAASSNEESPLPQQQRFGGNISNLHKFLR